MSVVKRGSTLSWGVGFTCTAFGTFTEQSADLTKTSDMAKLKDGQGETSAVVFFDAHEEGSFSYVQNHATAVTSPAIGDICSVTSTGQTWLSGSNWLCSDVNIKASNNDFVRVDVKLIKHSAVTS